MKSYRKRKKQRGRGDYQALSQINTANQNLALLNKLQKPKPTLQIPGQIFSGLQGYGKRRHRGGAVLVDKYGSFLRNF